MIYEEIIGDDDLVDFLAELEDSDKPSKVVEPLLATVWEGKYDRAKEAALIGLACVLASVRGATLNLSPAVVERARRLKVLRGRSAPDFVKRALTSIRGRSELRDLYRDAEVLHLFENTIDTLVALMDGAPVPIEKPPKFKTWDVMEIPLPDGKFAYARCYSGELYEGVAIRVYSTVRDHSGNPPIGERDFMFFARVRPLTLKGKQRPRLVGHDAVDLNEDPGYPTHFVQQASTGFRFELRDGPDRRLSTPEECRGLDRAFDWVGMGWVIERIMHGDSSRVIQEMIWPIYVDPVTSEPRTIPWSEWPFARTDDILPTGN